MARSNKNIEAKKRFLQTLSSPEGAGSISYTCKKTGWSRQTIYDWRKEDIEFNNAISNAILDGKEALADEAETSLLKLVRQGNVTATIFTLKSLRRDYYGEEKHQNNNEPTPGAPKNEEEANLMVHIANSKPDVRLYRRMCVG